MNLRKELPRIAARLLSNTHTFPDHMKEKFELISEAYGAAAVVADFTAWCEEVKEKNPRYPLSDYAKVVDSRLGHAAETVEVDTKDPRVMEIGAMAYKLTGYLASARSIAALLVSYPAEEIKAALSEYASSLDEKEYKMGMRTFFTENGAAAVIYTRRNRK